MNISQPTQNPVIDLALDTLDKQKQALIFVGSKRSAQKVALDIAKACKKSNRVTYEALSHSLHTVLPTPTDQCEKLKECTQYGIAFHHAGLASKQKELIETEFKKSQLPIIVCTPTLAAGMDLPAFRTILKDVKRFNPPWGMQYIPVLEYLQMAGRAGRPGKEDFGEAILVASSPNDSQKLIDIYINGQVEDIYSKLAVEPVLRTYVLSLLSTQICDTTQSLQDFFSKTFWAHQYGDMNQIQQIIQRVLGLLESYGFIEKTKTSQNEFLSANELTQNNQIHVTRLGERVCQLYIDPYSANQILEGLQKEDLNEFGIFQLLCSTLEMRPLLNVKVKEIEEMNQIVFTHEESFSQKIPTIYDEDYDDFYKTVKTTQYFLDWIEEKNEQELLTKYDIRPGEITAKNLIMDWLLYCCIELENCQKKRVHTKLLQNIRKRLTYGVKEDLLALLQLKQIGKVRARKLVEKGFHTPKDLNDVPLQTLSEIVGEAIAKTIKNQLGENHIITPKIEKKQLTQQSLSQF